ncbi:MAG: cytochrome b/b6 domain-containing protein [Chloroflexi bacterium]|nr:cytochrome b/b6 domain-containing protein [Chloroflexota bacterium]
MATVPESPKAVSVQEYRRFSSVQRAQHVLLILSFTLLALTGLPQKFAGDEWAETLIAWMGSIENVRIIHHYAAIVLIFVSIAEFIMIGYKIYVERARWTIFPVLQDAFDAFNQFFYNLGMRKDAPKYDRYTWGEKFEYWALVWGTAIMALTGFILWNPILSSKFLPGEWIPVAKAAHGGEAILAVLAILVWHIYNVHLKTFNKSMFNGKLSRREMEEEHSVELELLEQGKASYQAPAEIQQRRKRRYAPVAVIAGAVMLLALYLFVTAETTAISTLPPASAGQQVFAPRTFTPSATRVQLTQTPPPPTATLEPGKPTYTPAPPVSPTASGVAVANPLPADHAGRTVCQVCHATGVGSAPKNPPDHEGRLDSTCVDCHKLQ